jgi:hypothetical protein
MKYDDFLSKTNSCRNCNGNLSSNDPASQYQRQKLIQNTVRVASSLYTMNLEALSSYQYPLSNYQLVQQAGTPYIAPPSVNWNQMSDRAKPSNQVVKTGSGSTYHVSSTRHTIVRNRPGAMSPGGVGVDIKHNSYERRLNKLKGKSVLRRGIIPPFYGAPIPFNRAYPVYGGKTVKTAIINDCSCNNDNTDYKKIFDYPSIQDEILSVTYKFSLGDFVWAKKNNKLYKAQIIDIIGQLYTVKFVDDDTVVNISEQDLLIYFDCNCTYTPSLEEAVLNNRNSINDIDALNNASIALSCYLASTVIQE